MENQVARRRINSIAAHFAATTTDHDLSATHIFPMNCSSSLNSVIRRYDNRMNFARQGSSSQACFMRQGSLYQPLKSPGPAIEESSTASEAPLFSRPARMEPNFPKLGSIQPETQDCQLSSPDPPKFSRPTRMTSGQNQFRSMNQVDATKSNGTQWSPKMDVAESGRNYVVTLELPGVGINGIRVEVNDRNLIVMGKRSTQWWKVEGYSKSSISAYHKRGISQGPFQVVWPLPNNVNKDKVSAEFVNGFLQIILPKL